MLIEINPNTVIDEIIAVFDNYESYKREHKKLYPNGQHIYVDTPYKYVINYIYTERSEAKLMMASDILCNIDIYKLARIARNWYKKTNWQYCLSEMTAEKLIKLCTKS